MNIEHFTVTYNRNVWEQDDNSVIFYDEMERNSGTVGIYDGYDNFYSARYTGGECRVFFKAVPDNNMYLRLVYIPAPMVNFVAMPDHNTDEWIVVLRKNGVNYRDYYLVKQEVVDGKRVAYLYRDGYIIKITKSTSTAFVEAIKDGYLVICQPSTDGGTLTEESVKMNIGTEGLGVLKLTAFGETIPYIPVNEHTIAIDVDLDLGKPKFYIDSTDDIHINYIQGTWQTLGEISTDFAYSNEVYINVMHGKSFINRSHFCQSFFYSQCGGEINYRLPRAEYEHEGIDDVIVVDGERYNEYDTVSLLPGTHHITAEGNGGSAGYEYEAGLLNEYGVLSVELTASATTNVVYSPMLDTYLDNPTGDKTILVYDGGSNRYKISKWKGYETDGQLFIEFPQFNVLPAAWHCNATGGTMCYQCTVVHYLGDTSDPYDFISDCEFNFNYQCLFTCKITTNCSKGGVIDDNRTISLREYSFSGNGVLVAETLKWALTAGTATAQIFDEVTASELYNFDRSKGIVSILQSMHGNSYTWYNDGGNFTIDNYDSNHLMSWTTWKPGCFDIAMWSGIIVNSRECSAMPIYRHATDPSKDLYMFSFTDGTYGYGNVNLYDTTGVVRSGSKITFWSAIASDDGDDANMIRYEDSSLCHIANPWSPTSLARVIFSGCEFQDDMITYITQNERFNSVCYSPIEPDFLYIGRGENADYQLVEGYDIEVVDGCGDFWLVYRNTDGVLCYLPGTVVSRGANRSKEVLKMVDTVYSTAVKYRVQDYNTSGQNYYTVNFSNIPAEAYASDLLWSDVYYGYCGDYQGYIECSIDIDELEEDINNGSTNITMRITFVSY